MSGKPRYIQVLGFKFWGVNKNVCWGFVDYFDQKDDCNHEDLDKEKIETLFFGFRLYHHANNDARDERSD